MQISMLKVTLQAGVLTFSFIRRYSELIFIIMNDGKQARTTKRTVLLQRLHV